MKPCAAARLQIEYNKQHGITATTVKKSLHTSLETEMKARRTVAAAVKESEQELDQTEIIKLLEEEMLTAATQSGIRTRRPAARQDQRDERRPHHHQRRPVISRPRRRAAQNLATQKQRPRRWETESGEVTRQRRALLQQPQTILGRMQNRGADMLSPFPGMDPYLENPMLWPGVHHGLISEIQAELNQQLRPKYRASIEERVYLSDDDDPGREFVIPDVHVVRRGRSKHQQVAPAKNATALIEPVEISTLIYDEIHEARIEIVDVKDRAVITIIEILSITNKLAGSYGRKNYLQKRHEVMHSRSHLVEIDLLRAGNRMLIRERLQPHEYMVHVSRAEDDDGRRSTVWPIPIELPLPIIPVPLKPEDQDAEIDLQKMLAMTYEKGAYDLYLNYAEQPIPPLTNEQTSWAHTLMQAGPKP